MLESGLRKSRRSDVRSNGPPVDFETYGAISYNPLDYSGAIGRLFRVGVKHQF